MCNIHTKCAIYTCGNKTQISFLLSQKVEFKKKIHYIRIIYYFQIYTFGNKTLFSFYAFISYFPRGEVFEGDISKLIHRGLLRR